VNKKPDELREAILDLVSDELANIGTSALIVRRNGKFGLETEPLRRYLNACSNSLHSRIGALFDISEAENEDCPHNWPYRYCDVCKVDPCPIGLARGE